MKLYQGSVVSVVIVVVVVGFVFFFFNGRTVIAMDYGKTVFIEHMVGLLL